jgi:hypothetical protein
MAFSAMVRPLFHQTNDLPQGEALFNLGFDSGRNPFPFAMIFRHRAKVSSAPWDKCGARARALENGESNL